MNSPVAPSHPVTRASPPRHLEPREFAAWDRFVAGHPLGSICHTSAWRAALEDAFPHIKGHFLALFSPDGSEIIAGVPVYSLNSWLLGSRLVGIPFATQGDPLISNTHEMSQLRAPLLQLAATLSRGKVELRGVRNSNPLEDCGFSRTSTVKHHYIRLDRDLPEIYASFSRTAVRRMVSKAEKRGIVVRPAGSIDDLKAFYDLFVSTRRRLPLPPIPFRFFQALWNQFWPNHLEILIAWQDNLPCGAVLGLKWKSAYSLEFSGESPGLQSVGVNQLLYWSAIKRACQDGLSTFSFGRTSPQNPGLIAYKRHWGTIEEDLANLALTTNKPQPATAPELTLPYRIARLLAGSVPLPMFRWMGRFCYSHWG